ncbi:MAG: hypothetical protein ABS46_10450 [Cytophagaceae bacterium SCN 52-12]|nr:MAG: hypothetical protein ABS46_10450 [Cytophagaceae bacterium SCN 52-12]
MQLLPYHRVACFLLLLVLPAAGGAQDKLTDDGAWCWFSDPRAIYSHPRKNLVVTGWVTKDGSIEAASLDLKSGRTEKTTLYSKLEVDDHDNPAFLVLPNGNLLAMYTWHGGRKDAMGVIQNITSTPGNVRSFSEPRVFLPRTEELLKTFVRETYTYANPFMLSRENNRIYCFGRWIGFKPNLITSEDGGKTWSEPKVVVTSRNLDVNNRPYVKYYSDGISRVHMIFTDGHPAVEPLNSVYYCYYEDGSFWRADGSLICTLAQLPFHPSDASLVYQASQETGKAWIFDIVTDKGKPVVAYTRYPSDTLHHYYYARHEGGAWQHHKLIESGKWFPQTQPGAREREVNYSGGMTFDPSDPSVIYLSHQVNGRFEISKARREHSGNSWKITPVTRNSEFDNVRPFVPRFRKKGEKNVLLWMQNRKYIHYTDYDTSIMYKVIR